jgi:Rrf2 family protein
VKFSTRTLYGLKAVLVLANRYGEGSLSVSHIAKKERISVSYLEQILNALKKKGLVKSVRGPQGGYVLAEKPSDIDLVKLFYSLEARPFYEKNQPPQDGDEVAIGNAIFWHKFSSAIEKGLSQITLKELLDEARRIKKGKLRSPAPTFHI